MGQKERLEQKALQGILDKVEVLDSRALQDLPEFQGRWVQLECLDPPDLREGKATLVNKELLGNKDGLVQPEEQVPQEVPELLEIWDLQVNKETPGRQGQLVPPDSLVNRVLVVPQVCLPRLI